MTCENSSSSNEGVQEMHIGVEKSGNQPYVPCPKLVTAQDKDLYKRQREHIDNLILRYTKRTCTSKSLTQQHRFVLANNRDAAGFRPQWKEMVYQLIASRASGSKIWDVDGNEYIDLTMGFGVNLLGHMPEFIEKAVEEELKKGTPVGPMNPIAGEVAEMICELTGVERVAFFNSGTEAVMVALRIARGATGRTKIALFSGSYHGTMVRMDVMSTEGHAAVMASDIHQDMADNVLILNYGSEESLELVRKNGHELAAVLVETVQSRRPDFQPTEFLRKLREITTESGTALIFDEVITGFRVHPGGAQAWFGINADIVAYGKIVGGGMPIGIVAGKSRFIDGIDGGMWSYGDDSYPPNYEKRTFVAGTFCHHPIAMGAARAVLTHLKSQGPSLQQELNERTARFTGTLNKYFKQTGVPVHMVHFGSLFRFVLKGDLELLFYHLLHKGIYIGEGRNCFLSTAHTDEDIENIIRAVKESIEEMREGGFIPPIPSSSPSDKKKLPQSGYIAPLTEEQKQLWVLSKLEREQACIAIPEAGRLEGYDEDCYPLSSAQKRLFALEQFGNLSTTYNISWVIRIDGRVDKEHTEEIFRELVRSHEPLMTSFEMSGLELVQRIHSDVDFRLYYDEYETQDLEKAVDEFIRPFDLSKPSLLRVKLVKLPENKSAMILDMHHIISDGISGNILLKEFAALYEGKSLKPQRVQYKDFAVWQNSHLGEDTSKVMEEYWLNVFSGEIPVLDMHTDYQRPYAQSFEGSSMAFRLGCGLTARLRELASETGATLYMILLGAYNMLLSKYTGQQDIVVGSPALGRPREELENIIGMFVNTLPMRNYPKPEKPFRIFLEEVKNSVLGAFENQEYQIEELLEKLNIHREFNRNPLFDTMFALKNIDMDVPQLRIGTLTLTPYELKNKAAKFDITLEAVEKSHEITFNIGYCTKLFKKETVGRLAAHYLNILEAITKNPIVKLSEIEIITEEEKNRILFEFNNTKKEYTRNKTIYELFERQAAETPNNTAVLLGDRALTYRDLNNKANRLAVELRQRGVKPNCIAGIMIERSLEMVIGILGIMKAGGAYLPIDPEYPIDRINYMMEDSGACTLLTVRELLKKVPYNGEVVDIAHINEDCENFPNLEKTNISHDLAYIIYTSGTTGRPKGVMIKHGGITNTIQWRKDEYKLGADDSVLQLFSFSFDGFLTSFFTPIVSGARAVLLSEGGAKDPYAIINTIEAEKITHFIIVPTLYQAVLERASDEQLQSLRIVTLAGEKTGINTINLSKQRSPELELVNEYGPTEASVVATVYRDMQPGTQDIIGKPIANTRVYILDMDGKMQPVGVPGELCISGDGLAEGYLNRLKLTHEKFVPNPARNTQLTIDDGQLRDSHRQLVYKTGDRARWLPDGNLEFLGRFDEQVKVRGYRIEVREIESCLLAYAPVKEAIVTVRQDTGGNAALAAYVTAKEILTAKQLRNYLSGTLPVYMIPSYFVQLESIPVTPNGKIDKKALPEPSSRDLDT